MAEGGIAAALGNVWKEDNWQVHFRDTMRGGKMLNNWRMAQLHAQESPDRVLELEEWGALFDRTKDGLILAARLRRPPLRPAGPRRRPHRLEMIRTLQQHAVHKGIDVYMECNVQRLLKDGDRVCGAFGYWRAERQARRSSRPRPSCWPPAASARCTRSRRTPGSAPATASRSALDAGADLIDMECVQFHPTGMVWPPSVRGILVTEGVRGDGGTLKNSEGARFMFNYIPEFFKARDGRQRGGGRRLVRGQEEQPPHARPAAARRGRPRHQRRGQGRAGQPARRRLPRHRHAALRRLHPASACPRCTTSSRSWPTSTSPRSRWRSGPTCHYMMGGVRVDADTRGDRACPASSRPARWRRHARRQSARRQLALRPARLRPPRRARTPPQYAKALGGQA